MRISVYASETCTPFSRTHEIIAKQEPIVVELIESSHSKSGNMTVHQCDFPATKNDLVELRLGSVFVVRDPCVSIEWSYSSLKDCGMSVIRFKETPISEFCHESPDDRLCDKYAPGTVSPSTGVKELEKISRNVSTAPTPTLTPSLSPPPSSARRVPAILSLVVASLAVVVGVS